jgi:ATP-dependent RNA helicase DDX55/SPB4
LATQIAEVVKTFLGAFQNENNNSEITSTLTSMLLTGGNDIQQDIEQYRSNGATIVIATPGRLEYMLQYSDFHTHAKALEVLVLDEADRLLNMGFQVSLTSILSKLPKQRRTVCYVSLLYLTLKGPFFCNTKF